MQIVLKCSGARSSGSHQYTCASSVALESVHSFLPSQVTKAILLGDLILTN